MIHQGGKAVEVEISGEVGTATIGLVLTHLTIRSGAGKLMLACVADFGFATLVFAVSTNLCLSLIALMGAGGFDMVSMVIRQTLVQVSTPGAMRGRVSAVQWVFFGASSELGEFESGATAALFGTVPAALLGGLGMLAVVALWSKIFPEFLRDDARLTAVYLFTGLHGVVDDAHSKEKRVNRGRLADRMERLCFLANCSFASGKCARLQVREEN